MILKTTTGNEPGNLISIQCLLIIALMIQVVAVFLIQQKKNTMKNVIVLSPFFLINGHPIQGQRATQTRGLLNEAFLWM